MPSNVLMPKTGADMEEGKLLRWLKQEGDAISRGDVVAEIETDKVNMEVEAYSAGKLHILVPEGATMAVGKPIALLLKDGEQPPAPAAAGPTPATASATQAPAAGNAAQAPPDRPVAQTPGPAPAALPAQVAAMPQAPANGRAPDERIKASPLARRMAQEHGLDLARISGRGPGGRVVRDDIEAALQSGQTAIAAPAAVPAPAPAEAPSAPEPAPVPVAASGERALTRIQLAGARRMTESKQTTPHFYLTIEVDMAEAMRLRKTLNEQAGGEVKISVNDLVVKACAWALTRHPALNGSFSDGKLLLHERINIALAVDTEQGLVSPVIPDADKKSLGQIARDSRAVVERARNNKLRPEDYADGTFTVSNLGMFGIDTFIAIINPPQAAILAVGAVRQAPVARNGELAIGELMNVTLSADHRATDGAAGARFLADLRRALEQPLLMAL